MKVILRQQGIKGYMPAISMEYRPGDLMLLKTTLQPATE